MNLTGNSPAATERPMRRIKSTITSRKLLPEEFSPIQIWIVRCRHKPVQAGPYAPRFPRQRCRELALIDVSAFKEFWQE
jgi:hypothetical protein